MNASTLREWLTRAEATTIAAGGVATGIVLDSGLHGAMVTSGIDGGDRFYIDTWTRQVLRTLRLGHTVHAGNTVFDVRHGHVFMAVTPNALWQQPTSVSMQDAATGEVLYRTAVGIEGISAPAVDAATERLFVGTRHGRIYVLNTRTGAVLRLVHARSPVDALPVDAAERRVFAMQSLPFIQ